MKRYAIYYVPRPGAFADRAAAWLGMPRPGLPGVPDIDITAEARRYGFHGTLRAPFRPGDGVGEVEIMATTGDLAARLAPVICAGLRLEDLQGFLALTPDGANAGLSALAAEVVRATDPLRAPLTRAEIARRRPESLSPRQRALLDRWGYPFVMEEFRFHLTLTDRLPAELTDAVTDALQAHFAPALPRPFAVQDLCLMGEDAGGRFHLLHRYALTG